MNAEPCEIITASKYKTRKKISRIVLFSQDSNFKLTSEQDFNKGASVELSNLMCLKAADYLKLENLNIVSMSRNGRNHLWVRRM